MGVRGTLCHDIFCPVPFPASPSDLHRHVQTRTAANGPNRTVAALSVQEVFGRMRTKGFFELVPGALLWLLFFALQNSRAILGAPSSQSLAMKRFCFVARGTSRGFFVKIFARNCLEIEGRTSQTFSPYSWGFQRGV